MENLKVGQSVDVVKMICNIPPGIGFNNNFGIDLSKSSDQFYHEIHVNSINYKPILFVGDNSVIYASKKKFKRVGKLTITKVKSPIERKEFKLKYI